MKRTYFYNYTARKVDGLTLIYDRYNHGTFTSDVINDDPYVFVMDMANETYPDNTAINVTTLNLL